MILIGDANTTSGALTINLVWQYIGWSNKSTHENQRGTDLHILVFLSSLIHTQKQNRCFSIVALCKRLALKNDHVHMSTGSGLRLRISGGKGCTYTDNSIHTIPPQRLMYFMEFFNSSKPTGMPLRHVPEQKCNVPIMVLQTVPLPILCRHFTTM